MSGRPRQFDTDEALDRAMMVFWEKGFSGASLKDLLDRMGISRQSLYNTFGDKRALFLAALDRYGDRMGEQFEQLSRADAGLSEILGLFAGMVDKAGHNPKTCMAGRCSMEQGARDREIADRLQRLFGHAEHCIEKAIDNAKRDGDVPAHLDSLAVARHLSNTMHGLGVLMKGGADREHVEQVVTVALSVLGPKATLQAVR